MCKMINSIAIITARGGSKRIPRKNIKNFCGKPIIQYSIEAAINSEIFSEVMVSTDDEEIKELSIQLGAKVPFMRSVKNSNDYAMTHEVLLEVIEEYEKLNKKYDYIACIYPTAPFITAEKIISCMEILHKEKVDSVIPVVPFSFPPQRGLLINNKKVVFNSPEIMYARSQDLPVIYHDSGQFYCINTKRFLEEKKIIMDNTAPFILSELEVQDIDNDVDWKLAELKYRILMEDDIGGGK